MSHTILLIDDDADILKVLRANLEFHGFSVRTADSWKAGHEALSSGLPDLILLDVMLPDGDGYDICRDVRKEYPALPVIMLTAKDKISEKVMGLDCGADDYVVKPFETLELVARIKARLRRAKPADTGISLQGGLSIDFKKRIVKLDDKEVSLTPKEYELLTFLVSHKGEVISREDIRKLLWKDHKIYSWSRVIDVHIQHLRQKIEGDSSAPRLIRTIPGVGYMFRE
ncbi:MAG TPA: response regulator transcription factor [Dissulfurispiraceae bacterium]|nr:response regulator transcription factor [Dissulfurispiraceae bacterium]